jgi:amino acid permease
VYAERLDVLSLPESLQFGGWLGLVLLAYIAWLLYRTSMRALSEKQA